MSLPGEYFFVTADHSSPWDLVKATLQKKVSAETYENWISRTQYAGIDGSTLVVTVPDSTTQSVLKDDYSVRIQDAARACGLRTAYIERPLELGAKHPKDGQAVAANELHARDLLALAGLLGC